MTYYDYFRAAPPPGYWHAGEWRPFPKPHFPGHRWSTGGPGFGSSEDPRYHWLSVKCQDCDQETLLEAWGYATV